MRTFFILCAIFPCAAQVITLKHTSCFGSCPVYSLQIDSPGTVSYEGVQDVATIGRRTSSITPAQFQALVSGFTKIGFFELRDKYSAAISDLPTIFIGLTQGGQSKTIEDYLDAPPELRDLERQIERVVNVHQWLHDKTKQVTLNSPRMGLFMQNVEDLKSYSTAIGDAYYSIKPGSTPLMASVRPPEIVELRQAILSTKNLNAADETGWTALMLAAICDHADAVSMLLNAGAAPNQKDSHGDTALIGSASLNYHQNKDAAVLRLLLAKGAKVDLTNDAGESALMWAANAGYPLGVQVLLKAGADPQRKDQSGHNALFYAEKQRDTRKFDKEAYTEAASILKQVRTSAHPTHQLP